MDTPVFVKMPKKILRALNNDSRTVIAHNYEPEDIQFIGDNFLFLWDECIKRSPLYQQALDLVMGLPEVKEMALDLFESYYRSNDPTVEFNDDDIYAATIRCALTTMTFVFGRGPLLYILSKELENVIVGGFRALGDVLHVYKSNDVSDFQINGICSSISYASHEIFPTRPMHGCVIFLTFLEFPEEILAPLVHALVSRGATISPPITH